MHLHAAAWRAAARQASLRIDTASIYRWEGEPGTVTACRLLGPRRRHAAAAVLAEKERRFTALARRVTIQAPWARLLRGLHRKGVPLALVTGTSRHEVLRIVPEPVRRLFRVIVTGDQVRHGKPHPEPYRTACRRLRVRPAHTVVVENAPYGIRSARAAGTGWVIALVSSLPARYLCGADVLARSPQGVARALRQALAGRPSTSSGRPSRAVSRGGRIDTARCG